MLMFGPASPSLDTRQGMQRLSLGSKALVSTVADAALLLRLLTWNVGRCMVCGTLYLVVGLCCQPLHSVFVMTNSMYCRTHPTPAAQHLPCL